MKLIERYKNNLDYYKDKAVVMEPFIGWRGSIVPVGTLLYIKSHDNINYPNPSFFTVKDNYQVCAMTSRSDYKHLYLFNLSYMAEYYMFNKIGSIGDYEFYLNAERAFTKLGGMKYEINR